MRGLKDRTVLVTGGANGIGAAIARRLAEEGCAVGILDLDAATGETLVAEIKAAGGQRQPAHPRHHRLRRRRPRGRRF